MFSNSFRCRRLPAEVGGVLGDSPADSELTDAEVDGYNLIQLASSHAADNLHVSLVLLTSPFDNGIGEGEVAPQPLAGLHVHLHSGIAVAVLTHPAAVQHAVSAPGGEDLALGDAAGLAAHDFLSWLEIVTRLRLAASPL
jgi:hypothetical protein